MTTTPKYGYCSICGGGIHDGMFWILTGNMHRVHENSDHCIQRLHTSKGYIIASNGRRVRIPSSAQFQGYKKKQAAQSKERDRRTQHMRKELDV